jgi:hypothetical protein
LGENSPNLVTLRGSYIPWAKLGEIIDALMMLEKKRFQFSLKTFQTENAFSQKLVFQFAVQQFFDFFSAKPTSVTNFIDLFPNLKHCRARLPDFSWSKRTNIGKIYQMTPNYTKLP